MSIARSALQGSKPWRTCARCIRHPQYRRSSPITTGRFLSSTPSVRSQAARNPLRSNTDAGEAGLTREQAVARYQRSMMLSAAGILACAAAMYGVIKLDVFGLPEKESDGATTTTTTTITNTMKLDGPAGFPTSPSITQIQGLDGVQQVPTGTSTIPHFPSTIQLPKHLDDSSLSPGAELNVSEAASQESEEYQLLGLGIRTVSFLSIQVYVVGLYVAKSDIAELQHRLMQTAANPPIDQVEGITPAVATSLVPQERDQLKQLLLDPERGEAAWTAIIKANGLRTAFRIVPTRNTDFLHLRDGWVRSITNRAKASSSSSSSPDSSSVSEFQDETFRKALSEFRAAFGGGQRKNVPKAQPLLLIRGAQGTLDAVVQPDASKAVFRFMGRVTDERIGRLVWLNYLAGKTVASESARQSVVEGVMGIVERPVGTV
ncbi:hypothetical protein ASPZODRAFT_63725 [Penicilliopsis zonata CBS 506.65]|uniref:Chalcone isomerase domain-containing protein n=1 Tax=Penicilliopsis zonata CBS 506.65 TaxID=1073090 RepID=A0A1L9SKG4_9EURO|nr:hypothetical protein ASPZODRAFT_63725 [Penicilliopsis zonata CBS 506.65]OJJ47591.1 hypothetical protein ASPZODRAFT_63725 [Penicilliopsis zonata CBS 506.65]